MPRPTACAATLVLVLGLAGCTSNSSSTATSKGSPAAPTAAATSDSPTAPAVSSPTSAASADSLTISGFKYNPTPLTVAPGTTIPVKNLDGPEHTVTSDAKGLFLADDISSGSTVSFKAPAQPGRYTFHCEYHPNMHGTLIVR